MKTFILLILLSAVACQAEKSDAEKSDAEYSHAEDSYAEDTPEISSEVTELDSNNDGEIDLRLETVYRGRSRVMMIMSRRNEEGEIRVVSRSYLAGGVLRMTESDEDGDGFMETVVLLEPDPNDLEVFKRQADGSVRPVSTAALNIHKQMYALQDEVGNVMRDYQEGKIDPVGIKDRAREVREKGARLRQKLQEVEKHDNQ